MAAGFDVAHRTAEPPNQEISKMILSGNQIAIGVHRSEDIVGGDAPIERCDQAGKTDLTDEAEDVGIEQIHSDMLAASESIKDHLHK